VSKGERNRQIRRQARAIKEDHASDPRTTKSIARAIRRQGSAIGGGPTRDHSSWDTGTGLMSTIKSKIRRK
jgi:hypothetical protein